MSRTPSSQDVLANLALTAVSSIAPLIAEHAHVLRSTDVLKAAVVGYIVHTKALSKAEAASYLGVSERWIYKHLKQLDQLISTHYAIEVDVIEFFRQKDPGSASVLDCQHWLEQRGRRFEAAQLVNLIEAYCSLGYIAKDGHRFRWKQSLLSVDSAQLAGRAERVRQLMPEVVQLFKVYLEDHSMLLRRVKVTLTRNAYEQMKTEIKEATQAAMERAIRRSYEEAPEGFHDNGVDVVGVFMLAASKLPPTQ